MDIKTVIGILVIICGAVAINHCIKILAKTILELNRETNGVVYVVSIFDKDTNGFVVKAVYKNYCSAQNYVSFCATPSKYGITGAKFSVPDYCIQRFDISDY